MSERDVFTVERLVDLGVIERPIDGNHGSIHPKSSDFVPSGIPFIMASDLKNGKVDLEGCSFISEKQARGLAKGFSKSGDVLISHKATIGRTAIVQENDYPFIMLTPQVTYYRVKDESRLNRRFLKYYFDSRVFKDVFEAWAGAGSTRAYLGITAQKKLPILVPPINIQNDIASLVGPLDDKIEINRCMNQTLEAMARSIFKDWFVDFGPARTKLAEQEPYLHTDIWSLFPNSVGRDGVPDGWEQEPLSSFVEIIGGGTPKTSEESYWGGSIPWFSVVDTPPPGSIFVASTEKVITERGLSESAARLVPEGTTIISARGTVGNLAMAAVPMTFNQSCYGLRGRGPVGTCFTFLAAQHMVDRLRLMAHGSVFSTITKQTFDSLKLAMPPEKLLVAFEGVIQPLFAKIKANVLETQTLISMRDLLLPKLMSGELRVRSVEQAIEFDL